MKANEFLIIPRSEIEGQLNEYRKAYTEPENFAEYRMLQEMEANSRPLIPILKKAWQDGWRCRNSNERTKEDKQTFLNSDL